MNEEDRPLRAIGFWFSHFEHELPLPQLLPAWQHSSEELATLAHYLERGRILERYRGYSSCRFGCGIPHEQMGDADLTDGEWLWPEGLAHYVREHHVQLPDEFTSHVRQRVSAKESHGTKVSREFWLDWARRRDAAVDLSEPWHLVMREQLSWPEIDRLMPELKRELRPEHPLAFAPIKLLARRLDRDDILLRFTTSMKLAMVHLTWSGSEEPDGFPVTLLFETWAQWNRGRQSNDQAPST